MFDEGDSTGAPGTGLGSTDRSSALMSSFPPTERFGPGRPVMRSIGHQSVSMFWSIAVISLELNYITMAYICCVCGQTHHSRHPAGSRSDSVLINTVSCLSVISSLSICLSVVCLSVVCVCVSVVCLSVVCLYVCLSACQ